MGVELRRDGDAGVLRWGAPGAPYGFRSETDVAEALARTVTEGLAREEGGTLRAGLELGTGQAVSEALGVGLEKMYAGGGLMLAWYPPAEVAGSLALAGIDGALAAEDLHVTLLYMGQLEELDDLDLDLLLAVTKLYATRCAWALEGRISGTGTFVTPEGEDVEVALVDGASGVQERRNP